MVKLYLHKQWPSFTIKNESKHFMQTFSECTSLRVEASDIDCRICAPRPPVPGEGSPFPPADRKNPERSTKRRKSHPSLQGYELRCGRSEQTQACALVRTTANRTYFTCSLRLHIGSCGCDQLALRPFCEHQPADVTERNLRVNTPFHFLEVPRTEQIL